MLKDDNGFNVDGKVDIWRLRSHENGVIMIIIILLLMRRNYK